jgi:glycosyltransferase involved in cell wall biosynthesis
MVAETASDGSPRKRVLIIVQNLPVPLDRRVWLECQALVAAGYEAMVICPREPGARPVRYLDGVWIYTYPPPPATRGVLSFVVEFAYCWLRTALLAQQIWCLHGFDVIQACNPPDTYLLLALRYRRRGVRFVFDQHDLCPEVFEARFGRRGLLYRAVRLLERATYATAHRVIATNESFREIAVRRGRRDPADVSIVMSGPDPDRMRRGEPAPELRNGRRHLVCYLGIMGPQDGVDRLLRAARRLVHDLGRQDTQFAILGFGDCEAQLRGLASELDLDPWVTFTGRVDAAAIRQWLSTADIGVTPDPKNEFNDRATMNKTLEYMAHCLPVVATDLVETRRSAADAAVYVRTEDEMAAAIAGLLDDADRRRALGAAGRARVESQLSWQRQAPAYVRTFDLLLEGSVR